MQYELFSSSSLLKSKMEHPYELFPKTRYLGSKRKLLPFLFNAFSTLKFDSALDPFSGTGTVAYLLKSMGKSVTAHDSSVFNAACCRALVENESPIFGEVTSYVLKEIENIDLSDGFVERTFDGLFFFREENRFIDRCLAAMKNLEGYKHDAALYVLGQACLAKRPYNLFHRANLNMRQRDVARSFGNKVTWDKPFDEHMRRFAKEADRAVFRSVGPCRAGRCEVQHSADEEFDLVYLDPPYVSQKGAGVDYADYYHFLDGLAEPDRWQGKILHQYKHKPTSDKGRSPFSDFRRISAAFEAVIARFARSTIVVSYRSDGIPSVEEILHYLTQNGKSATVQDAGKYTYALSTNRSSREVLIVGK